MCPLSSVCCRDGRIHEGDQILAIDGQPLDSNISHLQAISILQKARGLVELVVARTDDGPAGLAAGLAGPAHGLAGLAGGAASSGASATASAAAGCLLTDAPSLAGLLAASAAAAPPGGPGGPGLPASAAGAAPASPSAVSDASKAGSDMVVSTSSASIKPDRTA